MKSPRSSRRLVLLLTLPCLYLLHLLLSAIYSAPAPQSSILETHDSLRAKQPTCPPCPVCPPVADTLQDGLRKTPASGVDEYGEVERAPTHDVPLRGDHLGRVRPDNDRSSYASPAEDDPKRPLAAAEIGKVTEVAEVSSHGDVVNVTQTRPAYAHFAAPTETGRASDVVDTFKDYKHADACGINSLDLHLPFSPLCPDKESLLAAMTGGGRAGYDTPFIPMGCDMRWYGTPEICTILSRFSHVFVIGDSLQRHVLNSLYMMLREDLGFGGITDWDVKPDVKANITEREHCKCSKQITTHVCSDQAIWHSDWVWGNASDTMACEKDDMPVITYHRLLGYPLSEDDLHSVTDPLERKQPAKPWVFIMHHELWNDVKIEDTRAWLDQVMDHFKATFPWLQTISNFPRLYVTANAGGRNKGLGFMVNQNNQALANFELGMMPRVAMMAVDFLGFFNMSIQSTQWDGAHTTLESNLIKTQMILNWLDRTGKEINYKMQ